MWHGKAAEELGDLDLATDIYDEVLANPRNSGEKGPVTGLEPLFAQVEYFRLLVVAKQKPREFLAEAADLAPTIPPLEADRRLPGRRLGTGQSPLCAVEEGDGPREGQTGLRRNAGKSSSRCPKSAANISRKRSC